MAGGGIPADISLGTANGVGAAQYLNRQLAVLPVLRPLILAVKAYLREKGLNEASIPHTGPIADVTAAPLRISATECYAYLCTTFCILYVRS